MRLVVAFRAGIPPSPREAAVLEAAPPCETDLRLGEVGWCRSANGRYCVLWLVERNEAAAAGEGDMFATKNPPRPVKASVTCQDSAPCQSLANTSSDAEDLV